MDITKRDVLVLAGIGLAPATVLTAGSFYRRDLRAARKRVASGSQIVETVGGPIEVAEAGAGPCVLIVHGAGGGYDQALAAGHLFFGDSYHVVAPSRFGYLRSPVPEDSSLEEQADRYAYLLDTLGIEQAVVMGISAGGPSVLHFARRHPGRMRALILYSAISYQEVPSPEEARKLATINRIIGSDLVYWLTIRGARTLLLELFGVSRVVHAELRPVDREILAQTLEAMLPMSDRIQGLSIDQGYLLPRNFPLGEIEAPALVLHARDDTLVPFDRAQHSARKIPNAELVAFDHGGHFLAGHVEEVIDLVSRFIRRLPPAREYERSTSARKEARDGEHAARARLSSTGA